MNTEHLLPARIPSDDSYSPGTARGTGRAVGGPLIATAASGRTTAGLIPAASIILAAAAVGICISITACSTTHTVPVPTPVPVPGPTQYVPIPAELLTCEDTGPPPVKGQPLGELYSWARQVRTEAIMCQARLAEARALAAPK